MADFLQLAITGIAVGLVYSLIALGFVLVWKSTGVANLALGQIVLIESWFAYGMLSQARLPAWLAFAVVLVFAVALGWAIERFVLRPLIAQPILSLVTVTLGLAYFLQGVAVFVWPVSVAALKIGDRPLFPVQTVSIGPAVVSPRDLWTAAIALVLFALLTLFFRYSRLGIAMRATADDQRAVQACGIPVTSIFLRSWMFACALAAVGGILMSSIGGITNGLIEAGLKSFSVVILGGLDSFLGAMLAGPIIGLAENLGDRYLSQVITWQGIKEVIPFIIIIVVMFIRPYGLLGEERIERI